MLFPESDTEGLKVLTVGQLTRKIKSLLETHPPFTQILVRGEVSNLTRHSSGHYYFTLKDDTAQIQAVMFRQHVQTSRYPHVKAGDQVQITGTLNVYPQRGNYQLLVYELEATGQGHLFAQFLKLKTQLESEGLFDTARKRNIPRFPACVGVITSPTGSVIRDIMHTIERRYPHLKILILPAAVQGVEALPSLLLAFKAAERLPQLDAIILARGGGSLEDLWSFNEETLARAIFACSKPVISAIGHETDFTIADFVADVRAPTPTAAAELVTRDRADLRDELRGLNRQFYQLLYNRLLNEQQLLDELQTALVRFTHLHLKQQRTTLQSKSNTLTQTLLSSFREEKANIINLKLQLLPVMHNRLQNERSRLDRMELVTALFDMQKMFERGYAQAFVGDQRIDVVEPQSLVDARIEIHYLHGKVVSRGIEVEVQQKPDSQASNETEEK